jgi:hypothetical protein
MGKTIKGLVNAGDNIQINLGIARETYNELYHINKFGFNDAIGSSYETVWDGGGTYSYPATAGTVQLTSDDSNDNTSTVEVEGLDANYDRVVETITVGGARGNQQFIRVFRMTVVLPATGTTNAGTITATHTQADSTDTTVAKIGAGNGQTLMAVFTVPNQHRAYVCKLQSTIEKKDRDNYTRLIARPNGGAFNIKGQWVSSGTATSYDYAVPLSFEGKTDIEVRMKCASTTPGGAIFDIILEDLR